MTGATTSERAYGIGAQDADWAHEVHDVREYQASTTGHAYARMRREANAMRRRTFHWERRHHWEVFRAW